jgi:pimeloyl-ACP methyl ester carboxylesterase
VAIDAVLRNPELFAGLFLVAGTVGGFAYSDAFLQREERNAAPARRGDFEAVADNWIHDEYQMPSADAAQRMRYRALRLDPANLRVYRGSGFPEAEPLKPAAIGRLDEVRTPAFVLVGALDHPDVRSIAELLQRRLPRARGVVIPGAGHLLPIERADTVARLIRVFVADHGGPSSRPK